MPKKEAIQLISDYKNELLPVGNSVVIEQIAFCVLVDQKPATDKLTHDLIERPDFIRLFTVVFHYLALYVFKGIGEQSF